MASTILEMQGITKTFPGVKALSNVNLDVEEGEIHAIVGENGAGKSTLMKVLSGVYPSGSYDGKIIYRGQECQFKGIHDSERVGIVIIHQELALVPMLSIAENIFLGNEQARYGVIDWNANETRTRALLKKVGLSEDPKTLITNLGVGKQQLVEIAKALSKEVKLLILDEPTASLSEKDSQALLDLLLEFKRQGMTSILISHKLNEVSRVADRVTVIRDGQTIETMARKDMSEDRIITSMVGRSLEDRYPPREPKIGDVIFEVENWSVYHPLHPERQVIRNIDMKVHKGEVVGIAGLMGAVRWVTAKKVDYQTPMMATSSGALPPGLVFNLFRGLDMVALITAPLILQLPSYWSVVIGAIVFWVLRGSFNMEDLRAEQEAAQRGVRGVRQLIDDHVVADKNGVFHGRGRHHERLQQQGRAKDQ